VQFLDKEQAEKWNGGKPMLMLKLSGSTEAMDVQQELTAKQLASLLACFGKKPKEIPFAYGIYVKDGECHSAWTHDNMLLDLKLDGMPPEGSLGTRVKARQDGRPNQWRGYGDGHSRRKARWISLQCWSRCKPTISTQEPICLLR
jgi:hypothetical protein